MAKTAMKIKQQRKQKFSTREYNRTDPGCEKGKLVKEEAIHDYE